jgi:subtilisin family serine protease
VGEPDGTADATPLPAWSLPAWAVADTVRPRTWPRVVSRAWALGGSTGAGVRVCLIDSGVDAAHPLVGALEQAVCVARRPDGTVSVDDDDLGDLSGHGTACASVIRSLAPGCRLSSARVLGAGATGSGHVLLAGLRWALEQRFDVVNLSLSTTKRDHVAELHELTDAAAFQGTLIVASAHNMPVASYPWRFSSVISVGSHDVPDPHVYYANPGPPVDVFARGVDVDVAWLGGTSIRASGNSFATPHVTAFCALIRAKHPRLAPYEVKSLLHVTANNVEGRR